MGRVDSLEKTLMLRRIEGRRRRGRQRMRRLDGITNLMDMSLVNSGSWWWTGRPGMLQFMESQRIGHDWVTEMNWTELLMRSSIFWYIILHFLLLKCSSGQMFGLLFIRWLIYFLWLCKNQYIYSILFVLNICTLSLSQIHSPCLWFAFNFTLGLFNKQKLLI